MRSQHALYTPAEMALADAAAPRLGRDVAALMRAAGTAVARAVRRRFRPCRTLVLAGPGNNGGDGLVAAEVLQGWGWPVRVATWGVATGRGTTGRGAVSTRCPVVPFAAAEVARAGLVIDAVFGAGLSRAVPGEVEAVLRAAAQVVAVDVPSGVDGGTGGRA